MCTCVVLVQILAVLRVAAPGRGLDDGRPEEPRIVDVPGDVEANFINSWLSEGLMMGLTGQVKMKPTQLFFSAKRKGVSEVWLSKVGRSRGRGRRLELGNWWTYKHSFQASCCFIVYSLSALDPDWGAYCNCHLQSRGSQQRTSRKV
jgi:hypothetical protein